MRATSSKGILTDTRRVRLNPSPFSGSGREQCPSANTPWGRCDGRSAPNISCIISTWWQHQFIERLMMEMYTVMNFFRVACKLLPGWISQMGRWAPVFSDTKTWTWLLKVMKSSITIYYFDKIEKSFLLGLPARADDEPQVEFRIRTSGGQQRGMRRTVGQLYFKGKCVLHNRNDVRSSQRQFRRVGNPFRL